MNNTRTRIALLLVTSLLAPLLNGQTFTTTTTPYGEVLRVQLSSAPFPHPLRANGYTYRSTRYPAELHYRDSSVALFIPKGFRTGKQTDFIVHFHGWYNNIDSTFSRYRLQEQVVESGKNVILVVPEGPRNAPDSFGGRVEDSAGFKRLMQDVVAFLFQQKKVKTRSIGNIILSGHSGAYHAIAFILMRGGMVTKIKEVYLFDALYGQTEKYAHWLDHYRGKVVTIYTDSGGTKAETESLLEDSPLHC